MNVLIKKKICFVTSARSEYGLIKWLMCDIKNSEIFELQIIVTGAHLLLSQGHTIDNIKNDGFDISYVVDANLDSTTTSKIAESMGNMAIGFSKAFAILKPDYLVVLGDRYELLPICNTAYVMNIPIIHISGGDITSGAIDDGIRNAITMLSKYHFPGCNDSKKNIIRMKGTDNNIWDVGEPGLDTYFKDKLFTKNDIINILKLDANKKWILFTYHPETKKKLDYNINIVKNCINVFKTLPEYQIIATYANVDFGGEQINAILSKCELNNVIVIPSLGNKLYLSLMRQVHAVVGNSSSGIVETPLFSIPTINIGNRQNGRYMCKNIIQSDGSENSIKECIKNIQYMDYEDKYYWGNGHASEKIIKILSKVLI